MRETTKEILACIGCCLIISGITVMFVLAV